VRVDHRKFLERQEEILRDDLTVNDFSVLVGMAQRHRAGGVRAAASAPGPQ
jgi:hypothetical protein